MTLTKLTLYGLLSLTVARISSINYCFRNLTSNSFLRLSNSIGMTLDCRSFIFIPLQLVTILELIYH